MLLPPVLNCTKCKKDKPPSHFDRASRERRGYSYWCKACKNEWLRRRPEKRKAQKAEQEKRWREANRERQAFNNQRANARKRGVSWEFSYEQWVEWWGEDIGKRGCRRDCLVMARYNDTGPYAEWNVRKTTVADNNAEMKARQKKGASIATTRAG